MAEADRQLGRAVDDGDLGLQHVLVAQPERFPLGAAHGLTRRAGLEIASERFVGAGAWSWHSDPQSDVIYQALGQSHSASADRRFPCPRRHAPSSSMHEQSQACMPTSWYGYYVLVMLTLCYVVNVVDRSQVLAASVQAIKEEFGASDVQLGMLERPAVRVVLLVPGDSDRRVGRPFEPPQRSGAGGGDVERNDGALRHGRELYDAVRWRASGRRSVKREAVRRRTRSSRTTFRRAGGDGFSIFALAVPVGTSLGAAIGGWGNRALGWRTTFIAGRACRASSWRSSCCLTVQGTAARYVGQLSAGGRDARDARA